MGPAGAMGRYRTLNIFKKLPQNFVVRLNPNFRYEARK